MSTISALPTPPSRRRPATFSDEADDFLAALPDFVTETNVVAGEVITNRNTTITYAAEALVSKQQAEVSEDAAAASAQSSAYAANAALASAEATIYNNSVVYNFPDTVITTNGLAYRCIGSLVVGDNPIGSVSGDWVQIFNAVPSNMPLIEDLFFLTSL